MNTSDGNHAISVRHDISASSILLITSNYNCLLKREWIQCYGSLKTHPFFKGMNELWKAPSVLLNWFKLSKIIEERGETDRSYGASKSHAKRKLIMRYALFVSLVLKYFVSNISVFVIRLERFMNYKFSINYSKIEFPF